MYLNPSMRTIDVHEEDAAIAAAVSAAIAAVAAAATAIDVGIGGIHSSHRDNIRAKEFQFCMSKSFLLIGYPLEGIPILNFSRFNFEEGTSNVNEKINANIFNVLF